MKFSFLTQRNILNAAVTIAVLTPTMAVGSVIARDSGLQQRTTTFILTNDEMTNWLATTDAELTYIGDSVNPLSSRSAQTTTVTYCTTRTNDVCGGSCNVYTGGATCLYAPGTNCLAATSDVGFCDGTGCGGSCNEFADCGTKLSNNFCYTPGTNSIIVSTA